MRARGFLWTIFGVDFVDERKQTTRYVLFHIAIPHDCSNVSQLYSLQVMSTVSHIEFKKATITVHALCTAAAKAVRCVNSFCLSFYAISRLLSKELRARRVFLEPLLPT